MTDQAINQTPKKPLILLIEDDSLLIKMYKAKFIAEGFEVIIASEGESGLKMALENPVSFIILDVMMPKLSGLEVLEKLRQNPKGKIIPVIVLSNLDQEEKSKKAIQLGAKEFLVKANFTPAQIVEKVRKYLGS